MPESFRVMGGVLLSAAVVAVTALVIAAGHWPVRSVVLGGLVILLGGMLALCIHQIVGQLDRHSKSIERSAALAEQHYTDVLRRIVHVVEGRNDQTKGHSRRVGQLSEKMARKLGLPDSLCSLMDLGGQLHDLGMLAISDSVLATCGRIGVEGFRTVKRHPIVSYELLEPLESLECILPAVRHHHERMNGTGYPAGLSGDDIPLEARILAVADTYDAMTHDRPHRPGISAGPAMKELLRCTPDGYDSRCVDALADVLHLKHF